MRRNRRFKKVPAAPAETEVTDDTCPVCDAAGTEPCQDKNGKRMGRPHKARHASD